MNCQITAQSVLSNNIGFIDAIKYTTYLITKTQFKNTTTEMENFFSTYESSFLKRMHALTVTELREIYSDLVANFEARYTEVSEKKNKVMNIIDIMSSEVQYYQNQLNMYEDILSDISVLNKMKMISMKLREGMSLTSDEEKFLAFHADLSQYTYYLKHFKLGFNKVILAKREQHERKTTEYKNMIDEEMKKMEKDIKYNKTEIKEIIDTLHSDRISQYLENINLDFEKTLDESELYLNAKLIDNLKNFMKINFTEARKIVEDKNFRQKIFPNVDVTYLTSVYESLNKEFVELLKVKSFLRKYTGVVHICPVCNFSSVRKINTVLHTAAAHKGSDKKTIQLFGVVTENSGVTCLNAPEYYKSPEALYHGIKKNYIKNDDLINKTIIVDDARIQNTERMFEMVDRITTDSNFEKIKNKAMLQTYINNFETEYSWLVSTDMMSKAELTILFKGFKSTIEKVSSTATLFNIKKITEELKREIIRNIVGKFATVSDVYNPIDNIMNIVSSIVNDNNTKMNVVDMIIQNTIHYDDASFFDQLEKVFDSSVELLLQLAEMKKSTNSEKIDNLFYRSIVFFNSKDTAGLSNKAIAKKNPTAIFRDNLNITKLFLAISMSAGNQTLKTELLSLQEQLKATGVELTENMNIFKPWSWVTSDKRSKLFSFFMNIKEESLVSLIQNIVQDGKLNEQLYDNVVKNTKISTKTLMQMRKQFKQIAKMAKSLYVNDIISHDISKIKSQKNYDNKKREYFANMMLVVMTGMISQLYNKNANLTNYLYDTISIISIVLPTQSRYLKTLSIPKKSDKKMPAQEKKTDSNKDDLLNDFFDTETTEDLEFEFVYETEIPVEAYEDEELSGENDGEDMTGSFEEEDIMEELFGSD